MPSRPLNVAVLMGGRASEHDISLKTGTVVVNALDRSKYRIWPIQIAKTGEWLLPDAPLGGESKWLPCDEQALPKIGGAVPDAPVRGSGRDLVPAEEVINRGIDVVFIAMHGRYGEDGCIQGLLEVLGLPYTGSDVLSSALSMDKVRSKEIVSFHGVLTPKWAVVTEYRWKTERARVVDEATKTFGYPCVAKIPEEGSSFGMGIPKNADELADVLDRNIAERGTMMIEEYIKGTEITCAVLGALPGEKPTALPLTEIIPKTARYFDFDAKYTPGASEEITPARLDAALTAKAQEYAIIAHDALGCGGMSRTDMMVRGREIFYLETNTIPGMTETSLYPQAAAAVGMSFPVLLDKQIELALAYHRRR